MKVNLCTPTNWSADHFYIEEFCEWYFALGIDVIYLIDDVDGPGNNGKSLLEIPYISKKVKSGRVKVLNTPGRHTWWDICPLFYATHKYEFDWLCIFDSDEYLRLKKHASIKEWLADPAYNFNNCDVIQISWRTYGDQGIVMRKPTNGKVTDTFLKTPSDVDRINTKIVARGGMLLPKFFIGHTCADFNGNATDRIKLPDGTIRGVYDPFINNPDYSIAELAHCSTKSTVEFVVRKARGGTTYPIAMLYQYIMNTAISTTKPMKKPQKRKRYSTGDLTY